MQLFFNDVVLADTVAYTSDLQALISTGSVSFDVEEILSGNVVEGVLLTWSIIDSTESTSTLLASENFLSELVSVIETRTNGLLSYPTEGNGNNTNIFDLI